MFEISARARELLGRLQSFIDDNVLPLEAEWAQHLGNAESRGKSFAPLQGLQQRARAQGLWNLFIADTRYGAGLSHLEYAPLAEAMGRSLLAPRVFNAGQPDNGIIDLLALYGSDAHRERWLRPLLAGEMRAALAVSEPGVGSSDPANLVATLAKRPEGYILHGRKNWVAGAADPTCKLLVVLGLSHPEATLSKRYSLALVPCDAHGITRSGAHSVFGYDDGAGGFAELDFDQVFVPEDAIVLGPGRGLEALQASSGPGRLQQGLMLLGLAQRAYEAALARVRSRVVFGRPLAQQPLVQVQIARDHGALEQARLLCLQAASALERRGNRLAREPIALVKASLPEIACQIIDHSIQLHGAAGLDSAHFLARAYTYARGQRLADGPEELHWLALGRMLADGKGKGA